jgi:hypothetical protein
MSRTRNSTSIPEARFAGLHHSTGAPSGPGKRTTIAIDLGIYRAESRSHVMSRRQRARQRCDA